MSIKGLIDQVVRGSTSSPAHPAEQGDYVARDTSRDSSKIFAPVIKSTPIVVRFFGKTILWSFLALLSTTIFVGVSIIFYQSPDQSEAIAAQLTSPGEEISKLDIQLIVDENGKISATENYYTNFTNTLGFTRLLPTMAVHDGGVRANISYSNIEVLRGKASDQELVSITKALLPPQKGIPAGFNAIRTTVQSEKLAPGAYHYQLNYSADGAVTKGENGAIFLWAITPLQMPLATRNLRVTIFFTPQASLRFALNEFTTYSRIWTINPKTQETRISPREKATRQFSVDKSAQQRGQLILNLSVPEGLRPFETWFIAAKLADRGEII